MELMKKTLLIGLVSILFFLASCKSTITPPSVIQNTPDVLSKPTKTSLVTETVAEIPKNVIITTPEKVSTEVLIAEETKAVVQETKEQIILPKDTAIIIPEKTDLQTTCNVPVVIDAKTEIVLPNGTEITIRKVNWYALLFYCLLLFGSAWYFIKLRTKDTNNDGFEDSEKTSKNKYNRSKK